MFDNVGRSNDEEATTRSMIALGSVGVLFLLVWVSVVVYGLIRVTEEVMGIEIIDDSMVEVIMEEEAELEAPPPPPPPPPPPAAASDPEPEDDDEPTEPEPDTMVEEVTELEKPPEDKQASAERPKGQEGGVEGGVEGGEVGGVLGGVVGGVVGGQLGGVRAFHHSEVTVKRKVQPVYPELAKTQNFGDVSCRVRIFIDETGAPYDIKYEACPKAFHGSVSEAIFKWRWYPAKDEKGGKVKATFLLNIKYKLT